MQLKCLIGFIMVVECRFYIYFDEFSSFNSEEKCDLIFTVEFLLMQSWCATSFPALTQQKRGSPLPSFGACLPRNRLVAVIVPVRYSNQSLHYFFRAILRVNTVPRVWWLTRSISRITKNKCYFPRSYKASSYSYTFIFHRIDKPTTPLLH